MVSEDESSKLSKKWGSEELYQDYLMGGRVRVTDNKNSYLSNQQQKSTLGSLEIRLTDPSEESRVEYILDRFRKQKIVV